MAISNKFAMILRRGMGVETEDPYKDLPDIKDEDEWRFLMWIARRQVVQGIMERGLRTFPADRRPPRKVLFEAIMHSQNFAAHNIKMNRVSVKVSEMLQQAGFKCCILKGQGNALAYPDPSARVPGDIDVWVAAPAERVISFARKSLPDAFACYHHVDFSKCDDVEVELHYRPAFLNNPIHNRRLQKWFLQKADEQCSNSVELGDGAGRINVPTDSFNRIFQMAHIMNHVVHEGLGMRQLMDYYFLLKKGFTPEEQELDAQLLRRFGLYDMAAAVMYTLQQLFALPTAEMIVPQDKRRGRVLLHEVLSGGNFGHGSIEFRKARTQWDRNMLRLRRDMKLLTLFPSECLWEPFFRLWHFFWRLRIKMRVRS